MLTTLWTGLSVGAIYALVALTCNVSLIASGVFNFAQAQIVMLGTFMAYVWQVDLRWPLMVSVILCAAVGAAVGLAEELLAIRPVRNARGYSYLVTTLGVGVAIEGIVYVAFGTDPRNLPFPGETKPLNILGGHVDTVDVALFTAAICVTIAFIIVNRYTSFGLASRATSEDSEAAAIRGVNVRKVSLLSFIISGAIGAACGPLVGPAIGVSFDTGNTLIVFGFMALALGGFGSYGGALLGGLVVGLIQAEAERYLPLGYSLIILYGVLLLTLLVLPRGLAGRRATRAV